MKTILVTGVFFTAHDKERHENALMISGPYKKHKEPVEGISFIARLQSDDIDFFHGGSCEDKHGKSILSNIEILPHKISFDKRYLGEMFSANDKLIHYELYRKGVEWLGSFKGQETGTGLVRCVVSDPIEGDFFNLEKALDLYPDATFLWPENMKINS